tara:strand:- start:553 stop:720 length:168 start_codon:yes stop_codon:yes gene_type:complete
MENRENNNRNGLSKLDNFYYVVGSVINHMSTVATTAIYTMGLYKLVQLVAEMNTL